METTLKEESLSYIRRIARSAKAEMPKNTTNTEKKRMIGYITYKMENLKDDTNPKVEENLINLLKMLHNDLANKKDELMISSFMNGRIPEGFEEISENSRVNRLKRLKMIVEFRISEAKVSIRKDYDKALEIINLELEKLK
ncbi:hypothetical protein [Clostridium mediterraneense]|uniref:hypothetical protein n=1 Tax=Clostridium mediterraneense TaxID=1805472 RepID=UPI0008339C4C|nr:hypothetical protein [Clostridium mediterraneense]